MRITISPTPFDPAVGYTIEVSEGMPPYAFDPLPEPPNPPGVTIQVNGNTATVQVPPGTPPGTPVHVDVTDASAPPQTAPTVSTVA